MTVLTPEIQAEEYGTPGKCPERGCDGVLAWDLEPRPVYATCGTCGRMAKIHCCDECAYGPWTLDDEQYLTD